MVVAVRPLHLTSREAEGQTRLVYGGQDLILTETSDGARFLVRPIQDATLAEV